MAGQAPWDNRDRAGQAVRSDRFLDGWREKKVSALMFCSGLLLIAGFGSLALFVALGSFDDGFILAGFLKGFDVSVLLHVGVACIAVSVFIAVLNFWLRRFMPWRYEIERDFIYMLVSAKLLDDDTRGSCFKYRIRISRFKREAKVFFKIKRADITPDVVQSRIGDPRRLFDGATYGAVEVLKGRDSRRYGACLLLRFGGSR